MQELLPKKSEPAAAERTNACFGSSGLDRLTTNLFYSSINPLHPLFFFLPLNINFFFFY
jgi:hypothetical protein